MTIPVGAKRYSEALEMTVALYRAVGAVLAKRGFEAALVGDEGGYGPRLRDNEQAFEIVVDAHRSPAVSSPAATWRSPSMWRRATSLTRPAGSTACVPAATQRSTPAGMIDLLAGWVERYPIVSIEDGLAEDDWEGWTALTERLGRSVQLIGDDLFATQVARLRPGSIAAPATPILIKLNQVGTLTETFDAFAAGPRPWFSHGRLGPLGRDRRHDDRRPGRRHRRRPDQDRLGGAVRAARQVQSAVEDRGRAGTGDRFSAFPQ